MGEHTPGPWEWHRTDDALNDDEAYFLKSKCGLVVLDALHENEVGPFISSSTANLRLIAAAPDLLAACEAEEAIGEHIRICATCQVDSYQCGTRTDLFLEARRLRRAALAKTKEAK